MALRPLKHKTLRGAAWCAASCCSNNSVRHPYKSFFRFPKDYERAVLWAQVLNRQGDLDRKGVHYMHRNLKVCSDHFDEKYFRRDSNRVRLSLEAVPSFNKKPENLSTEHFTDKTKDPCDYYISEDGSELIDTSNNCHYQLPINASIEDLGLKPVVSSNRKSRKSKKSSPSNHSEEFPDDAEVVYLTPKDLEDLNMIEPIIVVHGGAGNYTYADISRCLRGVRAAAIKGHQVVQSGGSILDATVAAVEVMEADPEFNAGTASFSFYDSPQY